LNKVGQFSLSLKHQNNNMRIIGFFTINNIFLFPNLNYPIIQTLKQLDKYYNNRIDRK